MLVIFLMTAIAVLRRCLELWGGVTLLASYLLMLPNQLKPCLVMVKQGFFPSLGCVTLSTLGSEDALVIIILTMASNTGHRSGFKVLRSVTAFTLDTLMLPFEGKTGFGVIKPDLTPDINIMASLALFTQRTFMHIFFFVTGITGLWSLSEFRLQVALCTLHVLVLPGEFKVRLLMIKTFWIKYDQAISSPLVFSMACFTLRGINLPMKAAFVFDIRFYLFVAGQAFVKELFLTKDMAF